MALGMPVALAFLAANIIGAWVFMGGERGISQLLNNGLGSLTKYALVPIPLFLLMGGLLGRLPGRLSYVTVIGGTAFSTLSGSSMGSTALLGSLMVPEMNHRGYKKHMSIGPILGTGGLAIIIPPSALAVLLATLAQIDVAALLIAGVIPGLVLASFYVAMITLQTRLDPTAAPAYEVEAMKLSSRLRLKWHRYPIRSCRFWCAWRTDSGVAISMPDDGVAQEIRGRYITRHADGLSDCIRISNLQSATRLLWGLAWADHVGHRF